MATGQYSAAIATRRAKAAAVVGAAAVRVAAAVVADATNSGSSLQGPVSTRALNPFKPSFPSPLCDSKKIVHRAKIQALRCAASDHDRAKSIVSLLRKRLAERHIRFWLKSAYNGLLIS